ncbi:G-type lectin S-receptor-like serine/threonine-protein kinase LECRK2 [Magnolia sinica]|uniref:G-type lectin S-receptor-like serine/threonine-protein kinase LECRK2 n=1 Tax=Magnolia sinica TaxID=86752 RepID=UPI0026586B49|nr:G-type lectin S-receptor-like serine/threonine-protein kinase LECRK2 [Magnolia sinica]
MAAILLFLLFLSTSSTATAQPKHTNITLESPLSATTQPTSWLSPSRLFAFGFYREGTGFKVGIWLETSPNKTIVWTANQDDPPLSGNSTLVLMNNGLFLKTAGAPDMIISGNNSSLPVYSASMLDSGNLVLYNSDYKSIWESFNYPTDTILGGQSLLPNYQLFSSASETDHSTGGFQLSMQTDANLVLYPKDTSHTPGDAYWATGTNTPGNILRLQLYQDGSLYLVNATGYNTSFGARRAVANNGNVIYRATLDVDGIFRLYSHSFTRSGISTMKMEWSALSNKCKVNSICGVNSYCTLSTDDKPNCLCLPGFNFTDPDKKFVGCSRNFTLEVCIDKKENFTYETSTVESVQFLDSSYATLSITKDECRKVCLDDCNCEAAMFENEKCMKLTLPLKYGRASESASSIIFIKVGHESSVDAITDSFPNVTRMVPGEIKKEPRVKILIAGIVLAACLVASIAFSCFLIYRNRAQSYKKMKDDNNLSLSEEIVLRSFSYNELVKATDNFKEELGKGSFGTVYKGSLYNSNRTVAVKRLEKMVEEGEREFRAETRAIGRTHHRNLVRLLGFCDEGSSRLLVYEYMSNGSLANLLFKAQSRHDWKERVRIALDVARGIFYLHEECEPHIIHCDIKPQNILMDGFWTAKISDFGLAKLLMPDQTRTFTGVRGTRGYLAPEWQKNTPISLKADVYSYGIVLLEIICCRRYIELEVPDNEIVLSEWVYSCFVGGELRKLLGGEEVEGKILDRMVKVGLWCIQDEPALRPSMKNVILMMEGNMDIPIPPSPTSSMNISF